MWKALLQDSWRLMIRDRKRMLLTMLGIVVGTGTLAFSQTVGEGLRQVVLRQLGSLTPDAIYVEVKAPETTGGESLYGTIAIETLVMGDKEAIDQLPNIKNTYGWYTGQEKMVYGDYSDTKTILALGETYPEIQRLDITQGRFYTESENRTKARVAVLGKGVAEDIGSAPIGEFIKLGTNKYSVIGVLPEQGSQGFFDPDDAVYIPVQTGQNAWGVRHLQAIVVQVENINLIEQTADRIRQVMRRRHKTDTPEEEDFRITTFTEVMGIVGDVTSGVNILLMAIAGISLLVGGVGIMNVMYVTVTERTAEIGLRKALGASSSAIQTQFLLESILITGLGGVLGLFGGAGIGFILSIALDGFGFGWDFSLPVSAVFLTVGSALIVGLLAGFAPARKASKLDAIISLQS